MRLVGGDAGDAGGGGVCAVSMGEATRVGGSVDGGRCTTGNLGDEGTDIGKGSGRMDIGKGSGT